MSIPLSGEGVQPANVVRQSKMVRIVFIYSVYKISEALASESAVNFSESEKFISGSWTAGRQDDILCNRSK